MHYLSELEDTETLVMYSGHPLGVFPSNINAPRCVITNGMVKHKPTQFYPNHKILIFHPSRLFQIIRARNIMKNFSPSEFPCNLQPLLDITTSIIFLCSIFNVRYGQMTAGSYCYIGPQGIVHGTYVNLSTI